MISRDLERLFEPRGLRRGEALLLREADALALIDKAQEQQIAILGVDQCRASSADTYPPLDRESMSFNLTRADSWRWARQFVTDLSGRDLLFEVALETPRATHVRRFQDHTAPLRTSSTAFQVFYLAYLALLLAVVIGIS